jgi:T4 RnlA family RNA ligase
MTYSFPKITHLQQVLDAIEGREEFVVKVDKENGYTVVNYLVNFEDTFPPVVDERTAILRECRGITFDTATGKVLSRKYQKFFNLGERAETMPENVVFSPNRPYRRFEKLDGSMITPLLIKGNVRWCTKMGLTQVAQPVDGWTADKPQYHELAKYWMSAGWTPIFEWCSRIQRIVIDYPETKLVLTAIRHNESGEYQPYEVLKDEAEAYGVPVVSASGLLYEYDSETVDEIRQLEGAEGDVWRFDDGHMIKLKGEWYSLLHKTLDHLKFEKDVIRLILDEKLDDAKPFLPPDLMSAADDFAKTIFTNVAKLASDIFWVAQADFDNFNGSKKKFAEKVMSEHKNMSNFYFAAWDKLDEGEAGMTQFILAHIGKSLATQSKVDNARHLWGGKCWYDYHKKITEE